MKTILLILIGGFLFAGGSGTSDKQNTSLQTTKANTTTDSLNFSNQIQPVFIKHCSPCHFPGGKMYARLPFDEPKTIIGHETGILKRIKDPDEVAKIKEFIRQNQSN